LVVAASMHICSAIGPEGVWGRTKVWHRKTRRSLCIPLPEQAGHNFLWHPKIRSRTVSGGPVVKVVHRLGRWVFIVVPPTNVPLVCELV
jgi:hypothetical protein